VGFAVKTARPEALQVQDNVSRVIHQVEAIVRSDFGCRASTPCRVCVVYCPGSEDLAAVIETVLPHLRKVRRDPNVGGRSLSENATVFITGKPDSRRLYESTAHEVTHTLCYLLLSSSGLIPWASEGYANLVVDHLLRRFKLGNPLLEHINVYRGFCTAGQAMSLKKLLLVRNQESELPEEKRGYFQSHATGFVSFLRWCGLRSPEINTVFHAAVGETIDSCEELLDMVEQAFRCPVAEIESRFLCYCESVATGMPPASAVP